jgi:RNA polymerase sigma factor (TIGR02999 family)
LAKLSLCSEFPCFHLCFHQVDLGEEWRYFRPKVLQLNPRQQMESQHLPTATSNQVTELLRKWREGDQAALDALMPLVYDELRRVAHHYLQRERPDHTLQSTAVVHEAYLRLVDAPAQFQNRQHFFAVASQLMREILVDYARRCRARKRDGGYKLALEEVVRLPTKDVDVIALDDALKELARLDARQARIVELRFFGGLSIEDTAEVLQISRATVERHWATARAWLHGEMKRKGPP